MDLRYGQEGGFPRIWVSGPMTPEDNSFLIGEIKRVFAPGSARLMVVCDESVDLLQTSTENHALQSQARAFFSGVQGGALAMVALNGIMFAVCRQFQQLATASRARLEVFGSVAEALDWLGGLPAEASGTGAA